ncbi:MAG: Ig domain-containing protein, partial [Gallionella sp.]
SILDPQSAVINPAAVNWNAATRTATLNLAGLPAGQYQLQISGNLRNSTQVRLANNYVSTFTAVLDMTSQLQLNFTNTRANRLTGEVSYDVSITNIGTDDLRGPLMLLLDPGRYFPNSISGSTNGTGNQSDLWIMNLSAGLQAMGGKLAVGASLLNQTITVAPADIFGTIPGSATLVKFNLGFGVYAVPLANIPPTLAVTGATDTTSNALPAATAGQAWSASIQAADADGTQFFWQIVQAPAGVTLTPTGTVAPNASGYSTQATLNWTPTSRDRVDSEIVVRVQDSRGGVALKRFTLNVAGGNFAPLIDPISDFTLTEGQSLALPISASDANGDSLTVTFKNLPNGASFNAATGILNWTPSYDQAGVYKDITVIVSDGKSTISEIFNVTVEQGYAKPLLGAMPQQMLREGDKFAVQLAGSMPGGLIQADGTAITLSYSTPWLPGGATLNAETGWFEWTPDYVQAGTYRVPLTLTATYTPSGNLPPLQGQGRGGDGVITTSVTSELVMEVLNANGAPQFDPVQTWNILEGQPLRISVFA